MTPRKKCVNISFPEEISLFRSIEDIGTLEEGKYGLPVFSNFPLVDAVVQPNMLLQMTVAPTNHKDAVERLNDIRGHLKGDENTHMMIFVVPYDNLGTFKRQNDLGDIKQFIFCPDPVIDKSKKRKMNL